MSDSQPRSKGHSLDHRFNHFILPIGYKGNLIKEYFLNYPHNSKEFSIDFKNGKKELINDTSEDWKISFLDTGESTMTGGRIKRAESIIGNEDFMLTYGDGLSNVNLKALQDFHKSHGKTATMTSVLPTERFGVFTSENDKVTSFVEKPNDSNSWINGGFFIFTNSIFDYLNSDNTSLEKEPLQSLANEGELMTFRHKEFWKCMDTLKDKNELQALWESGNPPWKIR